jgi:hexosaminidase
MKKYLSIIMLSLVPLLLLNTCKTKTTKVSIIPMPAEVTLRAGEFQIISETEIYFTGDESTGDLATLLSEMLTSRSGLQLNIKAYDESSALPGSILLKINEGMETGDEGYHLDIERKGLLLEATGNAGLFYGLQTLSQVLVDRLGEDSEITVPCIDILDSPRFKYRGMHLDVSRHFFPKEFIMKYIDYLAMYKMNRFHWHLVDDQGWRIEIMKYPRLTEVGAFRVDREHQHWNDREPAAPGEEATYGGFYTQDDIRDIVAYASSKYIEIIPEIEMPAHVISALAAYPELSCKQNELDVPPGGVWPITDIYCAGNEETFEFLENVLLEVIELFPSEYIHIGGDEATKVKWKECEKCQKRIVDEGLANVDELQSYFIKRIENFLNGKGKQIIGWDEILEGGLAPEATVMSWRGMEGGIEAARQGHDVIMTPTSHCYFDYYQGPRNLEPLAIGGWLPLSKVYSFEPLPAELTEDEKVHILGAQANVWTEYISTADHVEYMIFPRMPAIAEVVWSSNNSRNWEDFSGRILNHMGRWKSMGINYSSSALNVNFTFGIDTISRNITTELATDLPGIEIRYTLDGNDPDAGSLLYKKPVSIMENALLKAIAIHNGEPTGKVNEQSFSINLATAKKIDVHSDYAAYYDGGGDHCVVNGIRGSLDHRDGNWQGFEGNDISMTIDLGEEVPVSKISAGFLNKIDSWIFLPLTLTFELSADGETYSESNITRDVSDLNNSKVFVRDFQVLFEPTQTRFIKISAKNVGTIPEWHEGAGGKAWLFIDEIILE